MKRSENLKNSIAEALEMPKDIVLDLPKIIMVGNLQVVIENHKGIIEYTSNQIRIYTKLGTLRILGKSLLLKNIVLEEIVIVGEIKLVEFYD
jgi:sporulation protein YqfC